MIIKKIKKLFVFFDELYAIKKNKEEDVIVMKFLKNFDQIDFLEIGPGFGDFAKIVKEKYNFNITCIEKNKELSSIVNSKGLKVLNCDILDYDFPKSRYDVVHCSHVIEHLGYPSITKILDSFMKALKNNGYLIIRSPLMHDKFFFDIDHVRPYPPDCILNYFSNIQQQKKGEYEVREILRHYRRQALALSENINSKKVIKILNTILRIFWLILKFPKAKSNGYIQIIQKIS